MDLDNLFTIEEHLEIRKKLLGSLVRRNWGGGVGLVIDTRRYAGELHLRIAWVQSPFIKFQEERKIGWHNYTSVYAFCLVKHPI
tara:strand:+ start:568 stop:819 length:252 start_codon:yes stop_codon:yes gene_type:complete